MPCPGLKVDTNQIKWLPNAKYEDDCECVFTEFRMPIHMPDARSECV